MCAPCNQREGEVEKEKEKKPAENVFQQKSTQININSVGQSVESQAWCDASAQIYDAPETLHILHAKRVCAMIMPTETRTRRIKKYIM